MEYRSLTFVTDLWVVDMRGDARIVACRAPWERNTVGRRLAEQVSESEFERLSKTLFSYEMNPILSESTEGKLLIVLPTLMPSSACAVVLVPQLDRQMTLRFLAKRSGLSLDWNESLASEAAGRMPGKVAKYEEELACLVAEIRAMAFSSLAPSVLGKERRIDGFLRKRMDVIATLAGCSTDVAPRTEIKNSETFDFGGFTNFLLISLLLCRTASLDRLAKVGWENDAVTVRFLCEKEILEQFSWELNTLESLAEERLAHFGKSYREGELCLSLTPRRIDVSYLGLKANNPLA